MLGQWLLDLGVLKPVLTALVLPPAGPLLAIALGGYLARRRILSPYVGRSIAVLGWLLLWALSTQTAAVHLSRWLLPATPPITPAQLQQAQAVVVLGGGIRAYAPEYGQAELSGAGMQRLRYGALLARDHQLPLAYAGGVGWSQSPDMPSEASIAQRIAPYEWGVPVRWVDTASRDTQENGQFMLQQLEQAGIQRMVLVTHAWHMPRALKAFAHPTITVYPAPVGFITPYERPLLDALPSGYGLSNSRLVLREWLGLLLNR